MNRFVYGFLLVVASLSCNGYTYRLERLLAICHISIYVCWIYYYLHDIYRNLLVTELRKKLTKIRKERFED